MITFDPIGSDRLAFLQGQSHLQQYRLILSFFGIQPHGKDRHPDLHTLRERIYGTEKFVEALCLLYGEVVSPLELTHQNFQEVVHTWHLSKMEKNEFALRAKVAAWLSDLCYHEDDCIHPTKAKGCV